MNDRGADRQASVELPLERALNELPMLPSIVVRLMQLDSRSETFFEELLALLESDPPFALRCLRLANSAISGPEAPISTLPAAVSRLGSRTIVRWLTTMGVTQVFLPTSVGQQLLWSHSVETALATRILVRKSGRDSPELAYLAGLLHDIGRFLMFEDSPQLLEEVDEAGWSSPTTLIDAERRVLGYDHAELGGQACKLWGLPPLLGMVIRNHHRPAEDLDPEARRLVCAVQVADEVSILLKRHGSKLLSASATARHVVLERRWPRHVDPSLDLAGLEASLAELVEESDRTMRALGLSGRGPN